jgi:signal transduction histidine kinase
MMSSLALVTRYGELNEKDKQERHVGKIKSSIHTLTDILNDFLSVSKLEEGKIQNLPERFELTEFIHEIAAEMEGLLKEKQRIVLNITGVESVLLDKKLLRHILFNLISNAVKFSPEDTLIEIGAETQASAVKLSVRDHGMGISPQDQQSLFERFFRGRNATHIQGTGLGLHIVSKYVELMNATLTFESEENKGTTFFITFPQ